MAVADGAGSAPHGALGAALAVRAAIAALEGEGASDETARRALAALDGQGSDAAGLAHRVRAAALAARAAVVDAAADRGLPLRDLACTLTTALADDDSAAVLQIGDGLAVVRVAMDYAPGLLLAIDPARGEHANETTFLTSDGAVDRPAIAVLSVPATALALATDGLLRLALDVRAAAPHAAFFAPLFAFAARAGDDGAGALEAFLAGPRVRSRTDDDVTLVVALKRP